MDEYAALAMTLIIKTVKFNPGPIEPKSALPL